MKIIKEEINRLEDVENELMQELEAWEAYNNQENDVLRTDIKNIQKRIKSLKKVVKHHG